MKQTTHMLSRRGLLFAGAASFVIAACSGGSRTATAETGQGAPDADPYADSEWRTLTEAQWKERLSLKLSACCAVRTRNGLSPRHWSMKRPEAPIIARVVICRCLNPV